MVKVIINFKIKKVFKEMQDEDMKNNFVRGFPLNFMNKFINHTATISEKKGKYPFIIANTDSSSKRETHWWIIFYIEPKIDIFFFDLFGLDSLRQFIIQDDKKVIEKILFGTEQMTRTDNKITLVNIKFNLNTCKSLSKKVLDTLSDTATNSFQAFGNKLSAISSDYVIL